MRLLIDTDALLDFVAERPEAVRAWGKLNALELTGAAELWVTSSSYERVCAMLSAAMPEAEARSALRSTMGFLSVCSVDGADVRFALDHGSLPYAAAVAESCARKIHADFIVTNGGEIPVSRPVRRLTAEELFEVIEQEQGIVFDLIDF